MNRKKLTIVGLALMGAVTYGTASNEVKAQQAAKTEQIAPKELKALQKKVKNNFDSVGYHMELIKAMGIENPALFSLYEGWMKEKPKNANIPFALGAALENEYSPKAKTYLLKAIQINPNLKEAYAALWSDASRWGEEDKGREYLKKITEIDPEDASYAFYYASSFKNIDPEKNRSLSLAVADKFNTSERGAQALYWLAHQTSDVKEKEAIYVRLKKDFSPAKYNWTGSGMSAYSDLLMKQKRYTEAAALATELFEMTKQENWQQNAETAVKFAQYKEAKDSKDWDKALGVLDGIKVSRYSSVFKMIPVAKAEVLQQSGQTDQAFATLMEFYTKSPSPAIKESLTAYGQELGKDKGAVQAAISNSLRTNARVATPFELKNYAGSSNSLADFKEKVTFITYWYPGCGPCRGEFPHFENVVRKFTKDKLAYIGINIASSQNDYVLPFLKSTGYSFMPLEDVKGRDKGNLDNRGAAPMNFLIDKQGNLIFENFRTDADNEDELELMINEVSLL
ncbi:TlpA disulfide reductase family protein [Sphingobacterium paucimobilis]|uniref:Thioredoxin domain-containing protein n=1 Tax=Sphingobacterium paucimobilis HER1398 TaxID=1346330 RepID=U2J7Z4_9SPHI|nr:TlpA disulfide reductase family protein [Sphingobacterium paucimobilis]ERJ58778.1 hypothetical protein M472_08355 [Sphingobacterium paucimobilis HER1398]